MWLIRFEHWLFSRPELQSATSSFLDRRKYIHVGSLTDLPVGEGPGTNC